MFYHALVGKDEPAPEIEIELVNAVSGWGDAQHKDATQTISHTATGDEQYICFLGAGGGNAHDSGYSNDGIVNGVVTINGIEQTLIGNTFGKSAILNCKNGDVISISLTANYGNTDVTPCGGGAACSLYKFKK